MDKDMLVKGRHGQCSWTIMRDGTMVIYPTNGESGVLENQKNFDNVSPWAGYSSLITKVVVAKGVKTQANITGLFSNLENCEEMDLSNLNSEDARFAKFAFYGCESLKKLDLTNFNTSKIENMERMFGFCRSLESINMKGFDTSRVKNMSGMFMLCRSLTDIDLRGFDTSRVKHMGGMFYDCRSLKSLDLDNFNTSKVENMVGMFDRCFKLTSLNLSNFDAKNVRGMAGMFNKCKSLKELNLGDSFLESKLTNSFKKVPKDMQLISSNVDAINLGFEKETIRPFIEGKDLKWSPLKRVDDKDKERSAFNTPNGR